MTRAEIREVALDAWPQLTLDEREHLLDQAFGRSRTAAASLAAYISLGDRPSASAGDGELVDVPFAVKDNIDVKGFPTTAGSPVFEGDEPEVDAGVVSVLREAGAVVVGKTNMHELAFGVTSANARFGDVRNPFDTDRSAGGSSGGSAVAVALGAVAFSLGTDTGGSITIPASFCGVVGFRPTVGRYPADGIVNLSSTRDTVGLHTRTVSDARRVDTVITRERSVDPRSLSQTVLGVPRRRFTDISKEVASVTDRAMQKLARAGVRFVDVDIDDDYETGAGPGLELVLFEAERLLAQRIQSESVQIESFAEVPPLVASDDVRGLMDLIAASPLPVGAYEAARAARWRLRRAYSAAFDRSGVHAIISPACPVLAPPLGVNDVVELSGREEPLFATLTRNTAPGTVAGLPMLTIPAGSSESGLPVGICLEGASFADAALLRLGEQIESIALT